MKLKQMGSYCGNKKIIKKWHPVYNEVLNPNARSVYPKQL